MITIPLRSALVAAGPGVLQKVTAEFGAVAVAEAIDHHTRQGLIANVQAGTARDRTGVRSTFIGYDWTHCYVGNPEAVWADFFGAAIANSASRVARTLKP